MKANSQFDAKTLTELSDEQLQAMQQAGKDIDNCYRLLQKNEDYGNVVREVLKDQGTFVEYDHYPSGDVHDLSLIHI